MVRLCLRRQVPDIPRFHPPGGGPTHEPIDEVIRRWWPEGELPERAAQVVLLRAMGRGQHSIARELRMPHGAVRRYWDEACRVLFLRARRLSKSRPISRAFLLLAEGADRACVARAARVDVADIERVMARHLLMAMRAAEPPDVDARRCWEDETRRGSGGRDLH